MNPLAHQETQVDLIPAKGKSYLWPGTIVDDTFKVIRRLGAGTMGEVYLCSHLGQEGTELAMKVLRFSETTLAGNPGLLLRFENEAKAAYLVQHPNVVGCYSFIREKISFDSSSYEARDS